MAMTVVVVVVMTMANHLAVALEGPALADALAVLVSVFDQALARERLVTGQRRSVGGRSHQACTHDRCCGRTPKKVPHLRSLPDA